MVGEGREGEVRGVVVASTPAVLSILKLVIVASMAMGLGSVCFDSTTAFLHASLDPDEPPVFA